MSETFAHRVFTEMSTKDYKNKRIEIEYTLADGLAEKDLTYETGLVFANHLYSSKN